MAKGNAGGIVWLCVVIAILIVTVKDAYKAFLLHTSPPVAAPPPPLLAPSPPFTHSPNPAADSDSPLERALLFKGAPVDAKEKGNGFTALMVAALHNNVDRAKILIQAGANLHLQSNIDGSALCIAARSNHTEIALLLLEAGADVKSVDGGRALHRAVYRGNAEIVNAMLHKGANPNSRIDASGEADTHSVLRIAALQQQPAIVKLLLKAGANPNLQDLDFNPILLSILLGETIGFATSVIQPGEIKAKNRLEVARVLIENGADPNGRSRHNGTSVLTAAVAKAPLNLIKLLIQKGAKINVPGAYEQTPLIYAADRGAPEIVTLLLNHKANVNAVQRGVYGRTALFHATEKGSFTVVKLLLEQHANVNAVSTETYVIEKGLRSRKITVLDKALEMGHSDISALLIKRGAKTYSQLSSKKAI